MVQESSERLKKLRKHFAEVVGDIPTTADDISRGYPEQLKKIKEWLAAIAGNNYFLTPAIVKTVRMHKVEVYFAYNVSRQKKILRPYLRLVTDFDSGVILEFKNAYYSEFADDKKYPLNSTFNAEVPVARSIKEQTALLENLRALYMKVREFSFDNDLSADNKQTLRNYAECLSKTVPTDLLNFCKDTEPEFFNWVKTGVYSSR